MPFPTHGVCHSIGLLEQPFSVLERRVVQEDGFVSPKRSLGGLGPEHCSRDGFARASNLSRGTFSPGPELRVENCILGFEARIYSHRSATGVSHDELLRD